MVCPHHKRTRLSREQRGTTVKAARSDETWCQANDQVSTRTRPKRPQLPKLRDHVDVDDHRIVRRVK